MKDKGKKYIDIIIKIVLVIIIIILLIRNCELNKEKNKKKVPTGNVDIIEINCDSTDRCKKDDDKKEDSAVIDFSNKDKTLPVSGDTDKDSNVKIEVFDEDITWNGTKKAKIFTNSMYEIEDIIAPESENTYQFVVKNGTDINLFYSINFIETNPHNINMKYKLKKNDTYIIDHYVSANELKIDNYYLKGNKNDTYYLEWKWVSSDNDTKVGKTPNASYGLKIEVKAESANE